MRHQVKYYVWAVGLVLALPLAVRAATFTTIIYPGATITEAFGINDLGYVVGSYCTDADPAGGGGCSAPGTTPSHGYVRLLDTTTFKPINFPQAFETEATGINNAGHIVGLYDPKLSKVDAGLGYFCLFPCAPTNTFTSVVYPGATSTDFSGINNKGIVVGVWGDSHGGDHGFSCVLPCKDPKSFTAIEVNLPGATDTNAIGINDLGHIVGTYSDEHENGDPRGFLLIGTTYTTIACINPDTKLPLPTEAYGINNFGHVVGNYLDGQGLSHGFLWIKGKGCSTVDYPGAKETAATAINNYGFIVGNFVDPHDQEIAFIRHPNGQNVPVVGGLTAPGNGSNDDNGTGVPVVGSPTTPPGNGSSGNGHNK